MPLGTVDQIDALELRFVSRLGESRSFKKVLRRKIADTPVKKHATGGCHTHLQKSTHPREADRTVTGTLESRIGENTEEDRRGNGDRRHMERKLERRSNGDRDHAAESPDHESQVERVALCDPPRILLATDPPQVNASMNQAGYQENHHECHSNQAIVTEKLKILGVSESGLAEP